MSLGFQSYFRLGWVPQIRNWQSTCYVKCISKRKLPKWCSHVGCSSSKHCWHDSTSTSCNWTIRHYINKVSSYFIWTGWKWCNFVLYPCQVVFATIQQPFNGRLSGTTRVGQYQKKHSPAHTHPGQRTSFITFLHLQQSMATSLFSLRAAISMLCHLHLVSLSAPYLGVCLLA